MSDGSPPNMDKVAPHLVSGGVQVVLKRVEEGLPH